MKNNGLFITFEGGDGAGKSTHIKKLSAHFNKLGYDTVLTREPGGTTISEQVRDVLLAPENESMCPLTELFLYEAARAQIMNDVIKPALEEGKVVLCDRYFDSTIAYQGFGRGIDFDVIVNANELATDSLYPDRTIIMLPKNVEEGLARAAEVSKADRIEMAGHDFHKNVEKGFLYLAEKFPERIKVVKVQDTKDDTFSAVLDAVSDLV